MNDNGPQLSTPSRSESAERLRAAIQYLIDALERWAPNVQDDGRTYAPSYNVADALVQLDRATNGAIARMARSTRLEVR